MHTVTGLLHGLAWSAWLATALAAEDLSVPPPLPAETQSTSSPPAKRTPQPKGPCTNCGVIRSIEQSESERRPREMPSYIESPQYTEQRDFSRPVVGPLLGITFGKGQSTQTFVGAAGLRPDQTILDVGCGCAKVARPLVDFLSQDGEYHGIDIGADCIAWCRNAYRRFPNFHFHHADLFSTRYNRNGGSPASRYRFPLERGTVDLVFLGSVFTHLLPAEVENYLRETARVLRPGGRVIATYFILDDVSRLFFPPDYAVRQGVDRPLPAHHELVEALDVTPDREGDEFFVGPRHQA